MQVGEYPEDWCACRGQRLCKKAQGCVQESGGCFLHKAGIRYIGLMNASLVRDHAVQVLQSAIESVQPARLMRECLRVHDGVLTVAGHSIPVNSFERLYVIGAGKASAAMALESERILGDLITDGIVTTKYRHSLPTQRLRILEAAHPVPDGQGVAAVAQTLNLLAQVTSKDIVICLISGGASALWIDVPPGAALSEVQETFDQLIKCGASIEEINTVRKHLSAIKGGQLVRHCQGARVFTLLISDVPGDDAGVIASGPTVADASTFSDAYGVLARYGLLDQLPVAIVRHIEKGKAGSLPDTPKPGDPLFDRTVNLVTGNNHKAVRAAALQATALGYHTHIIPRLVTGDAVVEARLLVDTALSWQGPRPACLIQGGETTVKVTGKGKGGRNQHFVLTALRAMQSLPAGAAEVLTIVSGGTDGTDGPTDATGAVGDWDTLQQAAVLQLDLDAYWQRQNAYPFLEATGSLIITGPTQTNVMDVMIAIVQ